MARVDYRLVGQLYQQLPDDGRWTKRQRDKWVKALETAIDFLTEIIEEPETSRG